MIINIDILEWSRASYYWSVWCNDENDLLMTYLISFM